MLLGEYPSVALETHRNNGTGGPHIKYQHQQQIEVSLFHTPPPYGVGMRKAYTLRETAVVVSNQQHGYPEGGMTELATEASFGVSSRAFFRRINA